VLAEPAKADQLTLMILRYLQRVLKKQFVHRAQLKFQVTKLV
jgi:hypothetical protein